MTILTEVLKKFAELAKKPRCHRLFFRWRTLWESAILWEIYGQRNAYFSW